MTLRSFSEGISTDNKEPLPAQSESLKSFSETINVSPSQIKEEYEKAEKLLGTLKLLPEHKKQIIRAIKKGYTAKDITAAWKMWTAKACIPKGHPKYRKIIQAMHPGKSIPTTPIKVHRGPEWEFGESLKSFSEGIDIFDAATDWYNYYIGKGKKPKSKPKHPLGKTMEDLAYKWSLWAAGELKVSKTMLDKLITNLIKI